MPRAQTTPNPTATQLRQPLQKALGSEARSGAKVTVACKLPHGLLLRVFDMVERSELVMGGGSRTVKVAQQVGEMVRIRGNALPIGVQVSDVVHGWALTHNVDKDFIERWLVDNQDHDAVRNNQIFVCATQHEATDKAKEMAKVVSNLEPINPDPGAKDPRMVKGVKTAVEKEDA